MQEQHDDENSFSEILESAVADDASRLRSNVENTHDKANRLLRIRRGLRWTILLCTILGLGGIFLGNYLGLPDTYAIVPFLCLVIAAVCVPILFFMGGLMPARALRWMTEEERARYRRLRD